jgi:hypothetical protein
VTSLIEIGPVPDGEGFFFRVRGADANWFAHEHHAIIHALEVFPECEVVVYEGEGIIKRRYPPAKEE